MKANIDLIMVCGGTQGPSDKMHVPLGLLYIGSELERHGYDVKIWHLMGDEIEEAVPIMRDRQPLWIGLSVLTGITTLHAANYSRRIREEIPDAAIVWGGHHPTATPLDCLRAPYIDYVVLGEGEDTVVELSDALLTGGDLTTIENVGFISPDGLPIVNPLRTLVKDLDRFEINWELVDMASYRHDPGNGKISTSFYSSRGCPFDCTFCATPFYTGKQYRSHSPEYVARNLEYLKNRYQFNSVFFSDDNFMINKRRGMEVIQKLSRVGITVDTLDVRLNQLNDKIMASFSDNGVNGIFFGWESANDRILELMKKDLTVEYIREKIKLFRKYGITSWASSVIGCPTETREEIHNTIDFAMWLRDALPLKSVVSTYRYMPLPATPLFKVAVTEGFPIPAKQEDWAKIDPISPYYEMSWLKWMTEEDEKFFVFAQEGGRSGILNKIDLPFKPATIVHNMFVDRMRDKVRNRCLGPDLEYRMFKFMRDAGMRLLHGRKNITLTSQAVKKEPDCSEIKRPDHPVP